MIGVYVPTPSGEPLARIRWTGPGTVEIEPMEPTVPAARLTPESRLCWDNFAGVQVDLDLVPRIHARRTSEDAWGDIALLVFMLMMAVGVGQVNYLLAQLIQGAPTEEGSFEPTPELIARLLQKDFDGASEGRPLHSQRRSAPTAAPSFFLPAGNDGAWDRVGGGETAGREIRRTLPIEEIIAAGAPKPQSLPLEAEPLDDSDVLLAAIDVPDDSLNFGEHELDIADLNLPAPIERFVGWGFRDWFDVADGRNEVVERMSDQLSVARVKLAIDPNDPGAIQTAAYYAYLAQRYDLCAALYRHFIEQFPSDPSGYNNLALVLKRTGDYRSEEALYRTGLDLDPLDEHIMNNLAVNLAHQGRFDEANQLMDFLAEITPEDAYADLHRAKIQAAMGNTRRSLQYLRRALDGSANLDTFHHIEFRQDIRLDPAFASLRHTPKFRKLLDRRYGNDARPLIGLRPVVRGDHNG
jgi:tetratricopeptide (TPR) repeat protein